MTAQSGIEIGSDPDPLQQILPVGRSDRFEGVGFSATGDILAIAASDANAVFLFRQQSDGRFEDRYFQRVDGLDYPHDVSFSMCGDLELLAVAQREGAIAVFPIDRSRGGFALGPAFNIRGKASRLAYSDGVAFVPPSGEYLAACNLTAGTVSFFRRISLSPLQYDTAPEFEIRHRSLKHPDGLGFSSSGEWLATANHGGNSVSIFRRDPSSSQGRVRYGRAPVKVLRRGGLRYPHSVAFTPLTDHLIVTNAGANYLSTYAPAKGFFARGWTRSPVLRKRIGEDDTFRQVNMSNKQEGGPKGIAIHGNRLAVCGPEIGVKIYALAETSMSTN